MRRVELQDLVVRLGGSLAPVGGAGPRITGVHLDSRRVGAGDLFAAVSGSVEDAEYYAVEAVRRGASAVLARRAFDAGVPVWVVSEARKNAGLAAAVVYGEPAQSMFNVGITGTNGKTTTTELVARILKEAGLGGTPCGNYGAPLSEIVLSPDVPAAIALELSSFQLETIEDLRPRVSIWLNFAPDHMDRYPTVADYKNAKLRIFENQTAEDTVVMRYGEELGELVPNVITFSTETREADFFSDGVTIMQGGRMLLDLEAETSLRGMHNAENAMAAMAACMAYGIDPAIIPHALHGYAPPPHRCELIRTLDGVEYLNDSKATNLHALQCALRSQNRPVVLIAGGKDKGLDYSPLLPMLARQTISAVTFGQIARPLAALFSTAVPTTAVSTLSEAIHTARSLAPRGSTVLLSPGTSSFDQFNGYEQRGDTFRDLVHQLS